MPRKDLRRFYGPLHSSPEVNDEMARTSTKRRAGHKAPKATSKGASLVGLLPTGWEALSLRVSLFHQRTIPADAQLWKDLFGDDLKQATFAPNFNAVGVAENAIILLSIAPQRTDLIVGPLETTTPDPLGSSITQVEPVLTLLRSAAENLSNRLNGITRLATAGTFRLKVASRAEGYGLLPKYLPFLTEIDPDRYSDFNLQINSPVVIPKGGPGNTDITHNRHTRWNVLVARREERGALDSVQTTSHYALRAEFDITTSQEATLNLSGKSLRDAADRLFGHFAPLLEFGYSSAAIKKAQKA